MTSDGAGLLITADELASALSGAPAGVPSVLDVRWRLGGPPGIDIYVAGHVPEAVFVDLDRDLSGPPGPGGRHPMPAAAAFEAAMRRAGVSTGRPVVVYDDADSTAAARAWWLLRHFGHSSVRVLDGGFRAWTAEGQPVSSGPPLLVAPGDFTASPRHLELLDADGAAVMASTGLLLDARAGERYRGETEPVDPVAGHIPGAVSAPTADNVHPDGTFLAAADLTARFAALGAPPPPLASPLPPASPASALPSTSPGASVSATPPAVPAVGVYCGSGVTAAHEVLALAIAGIPAALYVGSWSDWITDPARPVATGPAPA